MRYEKPEVVVLETALTAVQGSKAGSIPEGNVHTVPAYEADE